jgi:hypothetical protein
MDSAPPGRIDVGPYRYRLVVDADRLPDGLYGQCDKGHQSIAVHPWQSPRRMRVTVLHEVLHACADVVGVDDDKAEERVVTVLAPALLAVLRDNPRLVGWLTGE